MNKRDPNKEKQLTRFIMTDDMKKAIEPRDEIEIWKRVIYKGVETNYLVSTLGQVKRIKVYSIRHPKFVTPYINRDKYIQVQLRINNKYYLPTVHKLVAEAFIEIPQHYIDDGYDITKLEVNHKNGHKYDNYAGNLEWVLPVENIRHAIRMGLVGKHTGIKNPKDPKSELKFNTKVRKYSHNRISNDDIHKICRMIEKNYSDLEISNSMKVSISLITDIREKKSWTNISSNYNIQKSNIRKGYLTEDEVREICKLIENKFSDKYIARKFNVEKHRIYKIRNHVRWTQISKDFNF